MRQLLVLTLAIALPAGSWCGDTPSIVTTDADGIWVFPGNGDGTFGGGVFYFVGTGVEPWHLLAADLNGDGLLDVASANRYGPSVALFMNTGAGLLDPVLLTNAGAKPYATEAGDFDGDGDLDLAVANPVAGGTLVLLANQGNGTFVPDGQLFLGEETYDAKAADIDGDLRLDLAVVNSGTDDVVILLGNGDGTFREVNRFASTDGPKACAFGSFNGDALPDLAVVNYDSASVTVFVNDGDGFFEPGRTYAAGVQPRHVVAEDLDLDGFDDLVVAGGRGSEEIFILYGQGDDRFSTAVPYRTGRRPNAVAAVDVSGDGRLDILAANWALDEEELACVSVLTATGAPRAFAKKADFAPPQGFAKITFLVAARLDGMAFVRGDVTRDGLINISDAIMSLRYIFGLKVITCVDAADVNDDGVVNIADSIRLLGFLFKATTAPAYPYPGAGLDPTPDTLTCIE